MQVTADGQTFWLPWQEVLVPPFTEEMCRGGVMTVNVLFIGAIEGQLLMLAIGYQQQL